jgi:acyl carrier protein
MQDAHQELRQQIKELIVTTLRLEGVTPEEIGDEQPLFAPESTLGLDSLSALELLSAIEYRYKVRFENDGLAKRHFESVLTLASFVQSALRS